MKSKKTDKEDIAENRFGNSQFMVGPAPGKVAKGKVKSKKMMPKGKGKKC